RSAFVSSAQASTRVVTAGACAKTSGAISAIEINTRPCSPVPFVAGRIATFARCRIAVAQLAASFEVAAARTELRAIERREQAAAARLTRDRGQRILRRRWASRRILRRIRRARSGAAVRVTDQHPSGFVDGDVVEV